MTTPEDEAREEIDHLLTQAGWIVCNPGDANIVAHHGVAIREFPLKSGHGEADYLFYVGGKAAGVIEAKPKGISQSAKDIGEVLRDYRNYIHPYKELSHGIRVDKHDARLFWKITKGILRQLIEKTK